MKPSSISATMPKTVITMRPIGPQVSIADLSTRKQAPLSLELVHQVQDVARVAAQPVELVNHQDVARPDKLDDRRQLVAAVTALAARLLGPDDVAACGLERGLLFPLLAT